MKILLLTKENNWCTEAQNWLKKSFGEDNVLVFSSNERYKKLPSDIFNVSGDLLISFLSLAGNFLYPFYGDTYQRRGKTGQSAGFRN